MGSQIGNLPIRYDQEASQHIVDAQSFTSERNNCYVSLDAAMKVLVYIGDTTKPDIDQLTTQYEHGQQAVAYPPFLVLLDKKHKPHCIGVV